MIGKFYMIRFFHIKKEDLNDMQKKFNVGDEVFDVTEPETKAIVTRYERGVLYVLFSDGSCGEEEPSIFKRTGRIYELKRILDEFKRECD